MKKLQRTILPEGSQGGPGPLRRAILEVLNHRATCCLGIGMLGALTIAPELGRAEGVFPPVFELRSLDPDFGGDGSQGFILNGIDASDYSGHSVSGAGDVNGDGIDDVLIGAHNADHHGILSAGESYVVFGRTTGFEAILPLASLLPALGGDGSAGFIIGGIEEGDDAGWSVSVAGDVNGDGIDDLIVGAPRADRGDLTLVGECYVLFGRTTGFPATFELRTLRARAGGDGSEGFILKGTQQSDGAGETVSGAGDLNADGIGDLLVTAGDAGGGLLNTRGLVYVMFGRTSGFPAEFALLQLHPMGGGDGSEGFVIQSIDPDARNGELSARDVGDVNDDGIDDVGISTRFSSRDVLNETYVVFGRSTGFPALVPLRELLPQQGGDGSDGFAVRGPESLGFYAYSLASAGDMNGDGIDDLAIGGVESGSDGGVVYLVFGRSTGFPALLELRDLRPPFGGDGSEGVIFTAIDDNDRAGRSLTRAGDVDGDGLGDLLIGAFHADLGIVEDAGESYVVFGRTSFPAILELESLLPLHGGDGSDGFILPGARAEDLSGTSVSNAGDVNGDGIDDVIIGAYGADPGGRTVAGASYVLFGRSGGAGPTRSGF